VGGQVEHRGHEAGIVKPCMEAGLLCRPQMCLPVRFIRHCEALRGGRLALQASNVLACQIHHGPTPQLLDQARSSDSRLVHVLS